MHHQETPPIRYGRPCRSPLEVATLRACLLGGAALAASGSAAFAGDCERLLDATLPNVTIQAAQSIPAGTYQPPGSTVAFTNLPAFCRVSATISPVPDSSIVIEVWLPERTWNGRYQQVGNHGWGSGIYLSEMAPQLQAGFATAATDDGHPGTPTASNNVSWGFGHPAKIEDFAYRAVHELAVNAKLLIAQYYGTPQRVAYFNSCSDGGREGMREAQQFPADFKGILIGGVASYWTHSSAELLVYGKNLESSGIQGAAGNAILDLSLQSVTQACDGKDGLVDGLITNVPACHWNPYVLVCKSGQDPATCITSAQADSIQANLDPVRDPVTGRYVVSGMERGSEYTQIGAKRDVGLNGFALATFQLGLNDPTWDGSTFDLHRDLPKVDKTLGIINSVDPDLRPFKAAGGKLIQYHGWDDASFTAGWETRYYRMVVDAVGGGDLAQVQDFYRLFMMPGVGHCGANSFGPVDIGAENDAGNQVPVSGDPDHDALSALMDWTENGVAPHRLIASAFANDDDPTQPVSIQRPLCPYPQLAVYDGTGDAARASSFRCEPPTDGFGSGG